MRKIRVPAALMVMVFVSAVTTADEEIKLSREEEAIVELTNKERAREKLPPLKVNARLLKCAREHSENMARQMKMDHVLDGKEPKDRVREAGYAFMNMGENVAYGQRTPVDVLKSWMNSNGHRENILRAEFTEIGVAVSRSSKGVPYYTQVFGRPLPK
jgi:uncharacterized protein YkwD